MVAENSSKGIMARLGIILFFFGALLFGPAGRLNWLEAWLFLIIYSAWAFPVVIWLKRNNPELFKERLSFFKKPAKGWDKIIVLAGTISFIALFLIAGFDAVRYQWSETPVFLQILGFLGLFPSLGLIFLVMRENTYLSRVVEVQKEKGHKVITTGPYKYVRHPMYVAVILLYFSIPLALGSLIALIPSSLLAIIIIIRTHLEDRTLHKELLGYEEYGKKVKYKLLPGVW